MIDFILIKYAHFIGIFAVVASLFTELVLIKPKVTSETIRLLSKIDGIYGLGAIITVGAGLAMWFGLGKPEAFYTNNLLFLFKVGVFSIVGLLSVWPTIFFVKHRKAEGEELVEIPNGIRVSILIEVVLLLVIPALAVLMANGIGSF